MGLNNYFGKQTSGDKRGDNIAWTWQHYIFIMNASKMKTFSLSWCSTIIAGVDILPKYMKLCPYDIGRIFTPVLSAKTRIDLEAILFDPNVTLLNRPLPWPRRPPTRTPYWKPREENRPNWFINWKASLKNWKATLMSPEKEQCPPMYYWKGSELAWVKKIHLGVVL